MRRNIMVRLITDFGISMVTGAYFSPERIIVCVYIFMYIHTGVCVYRWIHGCHFFVCVAEVN